MSETLTIALAEERRQTVTQAVREYGSKLFGYIRKRVKTNEDAEDILQDVWYQFSSVVDTEPIEQVSGWLFRVARNRIIDNYRKKKPVPMAEINEEDEDGAFSLSNILASEDSSPESEELKRLFREELMHALDELPKEQRDVFIWNEIEEQTFREISERTNENIKTLISRKRYAVMYLRERLGAIYNEFIRS